MRTAVVKARRGAAQGCWGMVVSRQLLARGNGERSQKGFMGYQLAGPQV